MISCSTSQNFKEVRMPFKNFGENPSLLIPIENIKSKSVLRFWIFESTSIDKVLIIFQDEKLSFKSELIEYGTVYNGKKQHEVYKKTYPNPINGYENLFIQLKDLEVENLKNNINTEVAYDEAFLDYIVEYNHEKKNTFRITIPESKYDNKSSYLEIIKLLKIEYNIK